MNTHITLHSVLVILTLGLVSFATHAQIETVTAAVDVIEPNQPAFPYFAEITGDNVYIRSGPGTNHYRCGRLNKGDIVKVVSARNVWSQIVPPEKSFSWVSKQYISIDPADPDTGVITADNVRVYAGSDFIDPIHSDRIQPHLNTNDKVTLLGEESGDYYKIVPPKGAFLWVSTQFARPIEMPDPPALETEPAVEIVAPQPGQPAVQPEQQPQPELSLPTPSLTPTTVSDESLRLKQYYELQDQFKVEYKKSLSEQNYTQIKQGLSELRQGDASDKAARYSKFLIGQVERIELASAVETEDRMQDEQLTDEIVDIETSQAEKLADFQDLGKFAVIGTLKRSNVYGPEEVLLHYIVTDAAGKVICYALPSSADARAGVKKHIGQRIGLVGKIEPHPQTAGALVKFTEIQPVI